MAKTNTSRDSEDSRVKSLNRLDLSKSLANFFAEEGIFLLVLAFCLPTDLSIRWGLGFSLLGIAFLAWEYGYQEKLPTIFGPYRIVRNPHSLALWLVSFGAAIAARSFPGVILSLVLLPWLFYIDHEENSLRPDSKLLRYRYRVPALIPTLIPYEASPNQGYSWRRAVKIQKWPARIRLLTALLLWVYIFVFINFNPPFWVGISLAIGAIVIKVLLEKRKFLSFAFRKRPKLSVKSS